MRSIRKFSSASFAFLLITLLSAPPALHAETLTGSVLNDVLTGGYGASTVDGGNGNDVLRGDPMAGDGASAAMVRISLKADGTEAKGWEAVASPDGGKIAFVSDTSGLVNDANGNPVTGRHIYLKNLEDNSITLVSANAMGVPANGSSSSPVFSPLGDKIAFVSFATNLAGVPQGGIQIFVKDLNSGGVEAISLSPEPPYDFGNMDSFYPTFSPDGSKVAFLSQATNLAFSDFNYVTGDPKTGWDVFIATLGDPGALVRASTDAAGNEIAASAQTYPIFSPDGGRISYATLNGLTAVVHIREIGPAVTSGVNQGNLTGPLVATLPGSSFYRKISFSPDGRDVAFSTELGNLGPTDNNGMQDIYVQTIDDNAASGYPKNSLRVISTSEANGNALATLDGDNLYPVFSPDGAKIAFVTTATNLVPGKTSSYRQIIAKDLKSGSLQLISRDPVSGLEGNNNCCIISLNAISFSGQGANIAFDSRADNLVTGTDLQSDDDVFLAALPAAPDGNDTVIGGGGADVLFGGPGADTLNGGSGDANTPGANNTAPTISGAMALTVAPNASIGPISFTAGDADGDSLTFSVSTAPTKGGVTLNGLYRTFTYQAGSNTGSDSFTISANDGKGGLAYLNVSITISTPPANAPPVITGPGVIYVPSNGLAGPFFFNASDSDGQALTFSIVQNPGNGFIQNLDPVGKSFTYQATQAVGNDGFIIQASDGMGGIAQLQVLVTIGSNTNNPPTIAGPTALTVAAGTSTGPIAFNAGDVDAGDTLFLSKQDDPLGPGSVTLDTVNKTFTYQAGGYGGTDQFTITASDDSGAVSTLTVTVTITPPVGNTPPTILGPAALSVQPNQTSPSLALILDDADGDILDVVIAQSPGKGVVTLGAGKTSFTYQAGPFTGNDSFVLAVLDGKGGSAFLSVTVTITAATNTPPAISGPTALTVQEGASSGPLSFSFEDQDAQDILTVSVTQSPTKGSVNLDLVNKTFTYQSTGASGTDSFAITVSDGKDASVLAVGVTITPLQNTPPSIASPFTAITVAPNASIGPLAFTATEPDAGDTLTLAIGTQGMLGTASIDPVNQTYSYQAGATPGLDSFSIVASDGKGASATLTVTVTISTKPNETPSLAGPSAFILVPGATAGPFALDAKDPEGDSLLFSIAVPPAKGNVSFTGAVFTYTAGPSVGTDAFILKVSDPNGASATLSVTATISATPTGTPGADLLYGGPGNDVLSGLAGNDTLHGKGGDDTLDGGAGVDLMNGGAGNDLYRVDEAGDQVVETANEGVDTVESSIAYTLPDHVENLKLLGNGALKGTGNAHANTLTGNNGANILDGAGGNDTLLGGQGNDALLGGAGNDALTGGFGKDTLTGGKGADVFVYTSIKDSPPKKSRRDRITDFNAAERDTIDVSKIDANTRRKGNQKFRFIGAKAFTGRPGQLRFKKGVLYADVNGDKRPDFAVNVKVTGGRLTKVRIRL